MTKKTTTGKVSSTRSEVAVAAVTTSDVGELFLLASEIGKAARELQREQAAAERALSEAEFVRQVAARYPASSGWTVQPVDATTVAVHTGSAWRLIDHHLRTRVPVLSEMRDIVERVEVQAANGRVKHEYRRGKHARCAHCKADLAARPLSGGLERVPRCAAWVKAAAWEEVGP